jgi:hypothetical protein
MEKILEKLSSYNIFNYLFPGIVFCDIADRYLSVPLLQDSIVNGLFLYYFVGLVISRFGSLVIEPILKEIGVVKFVNYSDFVKAAKEDPKIELLSESNNMYRTVLSALVILCGVALARKYFQDHLAIFDFLKYSILPVLVLIFGFSYKKQTEYITKRTATNNIPSN